MSRPEQAARVHDRAARQDDPGDSDPRPGEQQPQEEWGQQGGHQVCINKHVIYTSSCTCLCSKFVIFVFWHNSCLMVELCSVRQEVMSCQNYFEWSLLFVS